MSVSSRKRALVVALLGCALALGVVGVTVPKSHAQPSCEPIGEMTPAAERTVSSSDVSPLPGPQPEQTEFFSDDSYQVTRCDADGEVQLQQLVGPIPVPGGKTAMLPLGGFHRVGGLLQGASSIYPDPSDPAAAQAWQMYGEQLLAAVVPPTEDVDQ